MLRRRPLPVDLLEVLIAYYFMWHTCRPAPEQCEGCTWVTSQARELSYIHSRDVTFAVFCQGPYEESARYRDFMGWEMPWYAAPQDSLNTLLVGRRVGMMHIACYLQQPSKAFETYWTTVRGVEGMDNNYRLLDLTVYGRQEPWEDSPPGWPQQCTYTDQHRLADLATSVAGRTPHRSVASPDGWLFGRFGNRQSLNRAHQYIDRVPKSRDEKGFQFPMEWALRTARAARADVLLCQ